ncbi:ComEA family DNA-binding protein [Corynebacterium confusum]|uniref:ComEA family DNA-binding protein n=1 Tax=Corynebacterium confusum TaxID=71254 RepID=UPI0025B2B671|nr:helix-hairpin-helix domain-containing protein [Corynebacterium confusum]
MSAPHLSDRLKELTRPTGAEELMDVSFPAPRFRIPVAPAAVLGVFLILGLVVWVGCTALRDDPAEEAHLAWQEGGPEIEESNLALSGHPAEAGGAGVTATEQAAPTTGPVVVSVVGKVARPGLVTLDPGARVADALAAAGPLPEADLAQVNHAQVLQDAQQIHVVAPGETPVEPGGLQGGEGGSGGGDGTSENSDSTVNINTASASELQSLSGVGEVTAAAIVDYRDSIGGFSAVDQLLEVSGIGPAKFAQLEGQVTV